MKILFATPPLSMGKRYGTLTGAGSSAPTLGILQLAAVTRQHGVEPSLLDAAALDLYQATFLERLAEIALLAEPIVRGVADVVYGSRFSGGRPQRAHMFTHLMGNKFLSLVADILYNTTLSDIETCYKVFRSGILKEIKLRSRRFEIEPELTAKFCKNKYRIYEVPISYYGRSYDEGKKISWEDGFIALWTLLKYRFVD